MVLPIGHPTRHAAQPYHHVYVNVNIGFAPSIFALGGRTPGCLMRRWGRQGHGHEPMRVNAWVNGAEALTSMTYRSQHTVSSTKSIEPAINAIE